METWNGFWIRSRPGLRLTVRRAGARRMQRGSDMCNCKRRAAGRGARAGGWQIAHACAWLAISCTVGFSLQARATEHIMLHNGFELTCDHRGAAETPENVRLYLDAAESNYLDVRPGEIDQAEVLPAAATVPAASLNQPAGGRAELSAAELHELLAAAGAEHHLDVDLLASVVHAESGSHVRAVSRAGAQGLMQLMPRTAAQLGVRDSFAPSDNVHGGTAYLDSLLRRYHDNLALALAAYNAGPGAVDRYHGIPPYRETRAYVSRIIHEFNRRYAARQAAAALALVR